MNIVRFKIGNSIRLGILEKNEIIELNKINESTFKSFKSLILNAYKKNINVKDIIMMAIKNTKKDLNRLSFEELNRRNGHKRIIIPLDPPEIWGCGVTYKRSRQAREFETGVKGIYNLVYDAERPEIFFKGTYRNCVGPNEDIKIRGDSHWSVPEPELAFIIGSDNKIEGFTCGNDVSSRDIEGENPLYLPQAKIYDGCCALGPSIVTIDEVGLEPKLNIECKIFRSLECIFSGSINTSEMKRSIEELRSYLCRYNKVPIGTVCLTGTGLVPPDNFSLQEGDIVEIKIEKIGTLKNRVRKL